MKKNYSEDPLKNIADDILRKIEGKPVQDEDKLNRFLKHHERFKQINDKIIADGIQAKSWYQKLETLHDKFIRQLTLNALITLKIFHYGTRHHERIIEEKEENIIDISTLKRPKIGFELNFIKTQENGDEAYLLCEQNGIMGILYPPQEKTKNITIKDNKILLRVFDDKPVSGVVVFYLAYFKPGQKPDNQTIIDNAVHEIRKVIKS